MADSTGMPKFLAVDFYCGAGGTTRGLLKDRAKRRREE